MYKLYKGSGEVETYQSLMMIILMREKHIGGEYGFSNSQKRSLVLPFPSSLHILAT